MLFIAASMMLACIWYACAFLDARRCEQRKHVWQTGILATIFFVATFLFAAIHYGGVQC